MNLREVKVYDNRDVNVAQNRPATQSSNFSSAYAASKAVDGDLTTFSHTTTEQGKLSLFDFSTELLLSILTFF